MSSIDIISLYKRFGNFFKIHAKSLGKIYELGSEISSSIDDKTTIYYNGKYYSFRSYSGSHKSELTDDILVRFLRKRFYLSLKSTDYRFRRKKYCAYKDEIKQTYRDIFRIFKGFVYRIIFLENDFFLCIDPRIILESVSSIANLIQRGVLPSHLIDFSVRYESGEGFRIDGYLLETATGKELSQGLKSDYFCRINRYRKEKEEPVEEIVPAKNVFPESRPELLQSLLERLGIDYSIIRVVRSLSFLDSPTPSTDRFVRTMKIVEEFNDSGIFPLKFGGFLFKLDKQPIIIKL